MTKQTSPEKTQILLRDDDDLIVIRGRLRIEFNQEGITLYENNVRIYTALVIGEVMPQGHPQQGWIYGGVSPSTRLPFYIAPQDTGVLQWRMARRQATAQNARLPTRDELTRIYEAREKGALKNTFNQQNGWYWTSHEMDDRDFVHVQYFPDGTRDWFSKTDQALLRLVRS